jgi:hypothetical protein
MESAVMPRVPTAEVKAALNKVVTIMLAQQTATRPVSPSRSTFRRLPGIARLAVVLEVFLGIGALFGGGQFILAPDGHLLGMTTRMMAGTPFRSYLVPGIILFACVGVAPLLAAAITIRRHAMAPLAAVAVGLTLIGWISVEMVVLAGVSSLFWAFYLVLGTCIAAAGVAWWRSSPSEGKTPS